MRLMFRCWDELREVAKGVRLRLLVANALLTLLPPFTGPTIRTRVYRLTGMNLGPRVSLMSKVTVTGSGANPFRRLTVGEDSIISTNVLLNLEAPITIGRNVNVSQFVRIYTSKHSIGGPEQRFVPAFEPVPVVIEDGAWLGTGVVVLPGVRIGAGSVVSAGSYVSRDVPPNTLAAGVPAAVVKDLTDGPG